MRLGQMLRPPGQGGYFEWRPITTDDLKHKQEYHMTDEKDGNEKAIEKVVKKSVSDLFGEEEKKPEPPRQEKWSGTYPGYAGYPTGDPRSWAGSPQGGQSTFLWEKDPDGYMVRRTTNARVERNATEAAWGKPEPKPRETAMRTEYDDQGEITSINYTETGWAKLRGRVFRALLRELDFERIVLSSNDQTLLEQALDTVMRRSKFQSGREGNYFRKGSLTQVPISIGDAPPAGEKPLPASSVELDEGWSKDEDKETGEHDDRKS